MFIGNYNTYDIYGGAAKAAYRIHHSLLENSLRSTMYVNSASSGDWTVNYPTGNLNRFLPKLRHATGALLTKSLKTGNPVLHSAAILNSGWVQRINSSSIDVCHLHWINHEMMSIEDISKIRKPLVWTLHDMWAFCGAEHYSEDFRWRDGYNSKNRPFHEGGFDLNKWVWKRKKNAWKKPFHIVAPSNWLADCVRQSELMKGWTVSVVNNPIDTEVWHPVEKNYARSLMRLPIDVPILLFGALGGTTDSRKGFDLLFNALKHLQGHVNGLEIVVFGQLAPKNVMDLGFPIHYVGHLHDDLSLKILYSSADVMVVPSRQEAFGQTASEAHACGTPVVAFGACGLLDIVRHRITGYLAKPFDSVSLAEGIFWVLSDRERHANLRTAARLQALERFSYPVISDQYKKVYKSAIGSI